MRTIRRVVAGSAQVDGAGVRLVRVIGRADTREFDPFLMLDAFDSRNPDDYTRGFPWHPHRGIETVTYLINGDIEHSDSLGNKGSILDGCCQWMTAGSGILHQEMPQASERMLGVQLWLNLPRRDKLVRPQYRDLAAAMIPRVQEPGAAIGVIAGRYGQTTGATQGDYVKTLFLDVVLEPGREWQLSTAREDTLFVYIVDGAGCFAGDRHKVTGSRQAVLFNKGDRFVARAAEQGLRFLLFAAEPLREPIAWGGPIVMNTREELQQAFQELEDGTFIRK